MEHNPQDILLPAGFEELVRRVEAICARKGRAFVALDGRCGSGKTTLAALLAARWDCTLVHADDFFLRPEQRTPERMAQPGGNFDRERFFAEVLSPLLEGRNASYRPYDCHAGALKTPVAAPLRPVVLAEGSYTCHPDLWPCYDLHVFVTAPLEVRLARLARRPGVDLEAFRTRWIPLEEAYFAAGQLETAVRHGARDLKLFVILSGPGAPLPARKKRRRSFWLRRLCVM